MAIKSVNHAILFSYMYFNLQTIDYGPFRTLEPLRGEHQECREIIEVTI